MDDVKDPDNADEPVGLVMPASPYLHTAIFALGAGVFTQIGAGFIFTLWIEQRYGTSELLSMAEDPSRMEELLSLVPPAELFEINTAGLALALFYALLFWRFLRRGAVADLGMPKGIAGPMGIGKGFLQGLGLIGVIVLGGMAIGDLRFSGAGFQGDLFGQGFLGGLSTLLMVFLAAFCEEVVTRGYIYQVLRRTRGILPALLVPTAVFGLAHGANPGVSATAVFGTALAGFYFALVTLRDGNLWRAAGLHWGWNFAMGFVFSLPVSGLTIQGVVFWEEGPLSAFWMGGDFGPEAGFFGIGVLALGCAYEAWHLSENGVPDLPEDVGLPVFEEG